MSVKHHEVLRHIHAGDDTGGLVHAKEMSFLNFLKMICSSVSNFGYCSCDVA